MITWVLTSVSCIPYVTVFLTELASLSLIVVFVLLLITSLLRYHYPFMCYAKWPVTEPHVSWLMSLETYTRRSAYHLPRCNSVCNNASPKRNTTVTSAAKTVGEKRSLGHARYRLDAGCWDSHPRGRNPLFVNTLGLMVFLPWTKTKTTTLSFLGLHLFTQLGVVLVLLTALH